MDVLTTQHSGRHPETNNYDEEESSSFSKVNDNDEYLSDGGSSETDTETCSNSSEKLTIGAGCEEQSHAKEM